MEETAVMGVGTALVQGLLGYLITIVVALGTAGLIAVMVKGLKRRQASPVALVAPTAAMPAVTVDEAEIKRRVAVVAAAVATVAGRTRIVRIDEAVVPGLWRTTGRAMHHRSHVPHR
jgi:hypothetical protein